MSLSLGQTLAGLLNATFGNAVEIIVGITALLQDQIRIVQTSVRYFLLSWYKSLTILVEGAKVQGRCHPDWSSGVAVEAGRKRCASRPTHVRRRCIAHDAMGAARDANYSGADPRLFRYLEPLERVLT